MRLAVQLYTLRENLDSDLPATMKSVRECGYRVVETAGLHGRTPEAFREELDRAGLVAVACHVGLPEVEDSLDQTAAMAKALGATWLVVPWIGKEVYADGWGKFGERLGRAADNALSKGLRLAYHNHDFEFAPENSKPGFQRLWDTAPVTVEAELDVYWAHFAGHDPSDWLRNLAGRISLAHFKDGKDGKFTPVGEGTLDWLPIVKAAETAGVEYAIVELDECPRDPVDCVASSAKYLQGLGINP